MVARRVRFTPGDSWEFPPELLEFDGGRFASGRDWLAARRDVMPSPSSGAISGGRWLILLQEHYAIMRELRATDSW
jgi:hypothetical protein